LPRAEYKALIGSAKDILVPAGEELYRQNDASGVRHVYFPTIGMISLTVCMEDGKEVEVATIGAEGFVGLPVALGLEATPTRAIGQISGGGLRIPAPVFLRVMKPGSALETLVRRYAAYSLSYGSQTIACNLLHSVKRRLCRWLLLSHDRVARDDFALTHKFLSEMLGVRRQTVTVIARELQAAGLIKYRRGVLHVVNRQGLERASCECYGVIMMFYERLMGEAPA
jgi:CRP-like cAMP-binding protein